MFHLDLLRLKRKKITSKGSWKRTGCAPINPFKTQKKRFLKTRSWKWGNTSLKELPSALSKKLFLTIFQRIEKQHAKILSKCITECFQYGVYPESAK